MQGVSLMTDPNGKPCGESGRPLRELALQRVAEIHERIGTNAAQIGRAHV